MKDGLEQMLVLRDNAKNQLEKIKSVEEGITYLNKVAAIEKWVKAEKMDAELQNIVAEQKLRTQRVLGDLLKESEIKKGGNPTMVSKDDHRDRRETLSDIGLTKQQSHTFQQIASIPDEKFEEFIAEKKEAVNNAVSELTTTGALRLAKSLKEKDDSLEIMQDINEELRVNKELKELAKEINMKYTKEQRKTLVSFIKI